MRQLPNESAADFQTRVKELQRLPNESATDHARRVVKVNNERALAYAARKKAGDDRLQLWRKMQTFDEWFEALPEDQRKLNLDQWRASAEKEMKPFYDRMQARETEMRGLEQEGQAQDKKKLEMKRADIEREADYADKLYQKQLEKVDIDRKRNQEDFLRLTAYAKSDTAKALADIDRGFAKSLTEAANAYGVRGIANSGIQAANNAVMRETVADDKANIYEKFKRGYAEDQLALNRANQDADLTAEGVVAAREQAGKAAESSLQEMDMANQDLRLADRIGAAKSRQNLEDIASDREAAVAKATVLNKQSYWQEAWRRQLADTQPGSALPGQQMPEKLDKPLTANPLAKPTVTKRTHTTDERADAAIRAAQIKRGLSR